MGAQWHAFIVDNASTDESIDKLSNLGDDVTLIQSPMNSGWTGGNNQGLKEALRAGFKYFFILNNDALVLPDTIAVLQSSLENHTLNPVLGPVHWDLDQVNPEFVGAATNPRTGLPENQAGKDALNRKETNLYSTAYIRGAGIFFTADHISQVGFFDDRFFLNYDETDWCFRARQLGFDVLMCKNARILHSGSASIGGYLSPLNVYFLVRNALLFSENYCTKKQRVMVLKGLAWEFSNARDVRGYYRRLAFLIFSQNRVAKSFRSGLEDYLLRRFGDCPPEIRIK